METSKPHPHLEKPKMFKSYYVVWKQHGRKIYHKSLYRFKSYYVVWKLPICSFATIFEGRFKSYYVVWKLRKYGISMVIYNCLNRTM